jgi:hypothetical protein
MATYNNPVKHADLTDQDIAAIERKVIRTSRDGDFWDRFVDHKKWNRGADTLKYRRLVPPAVTVAGIQTLVENVAPDFDTMTYATYSVAVSSYGGKIGYTKEDILYNYDDIVADIAHNVDYQVGDTLELLKGKEFVASPITVTAAASVRATLAALKVQLVKNKCKPEFSDGLYACVMTPELINTLKDELVTLGTSLPEDTKSDITKYGSVYVYNGFRIMERADEFLYKTVDSTAKSFIVTFGKTKEGEHALVAYNGVEPEIRHNPLGSGVIKNANGDVVADSNGQRGDVAWNIWAMAVAHKNDLALCTSLFNTTAVATSNAAKPGNSAQSGYVSASTSPAA